VHIHRAARTVACAEAPTTISKELPTYALSNSELFSSFLLLTLGTEPSFLTPFLVNGPSFSVRRFSLSLVTALVLGLGLLACGGSDEATSEEAETGLVIRDEEGPAPTAEEAKKALDESLQAFNPFCLTPIAENEADYPITLVNPNSRAPSHQYRELWALKQAGLLDTSAAQSTGGLPVHKFSLSKKGEQTRYEIAQSRSYRRMFCYAVPVVTQLDSIKSVYNSGPNSLARVWFSYGYTDLAPWVNTPILQRTFSNLNPLPSKKETYNTKKLLVRVDSAWVERRLTGYERPPKRPNPPTEQ
jgi:hypothetical protein